MTPPTVAVVAIALAVASCGADKVLTDEALRAYAARDYDKQAMMGKKVVLGRHHGVRVVAEFPCSDVCPDYTTRIIHYDLGRHDTCAAVGGVERMEDVPVGIGAEQTKFCEPRAIPAASGTTVADKKVMQ